MRGWAGKAVEPVCASGLRGLDHRTWIATHVLAALLSDGAPQDPDVVAERALGYADAMLMALNPPRSRRKSAAPGSVKVS